MAATITFTTESTACDLIPAYDNSGVLCEGIFIHINSTCVTVYDCPNNDFNTCYSVTIGSTCGGTDGGCWAPSTTTQISSQSGLSGNYRVNEVNGYCIKLCACQ